MFLSMIDGYNSTVNTDQRLCTGEITYHWLLVKSGSVIYMDIFFNRPLIRLVITCLPYLPEIYVDSAINVFQIYVVAAIIVFQCWTLSK